MLDPNKLIHHMQLGLSRFLHPNDKEKFRHKQGCEHG
ncbi:Uncharacterised protein [Chlamydia trachomatis]|nr:Uncharacterised protein [Chlamydia trachomatis]